MIVRLFQFQATLVRVKGTNIPVSNSFYSNYDEAKREFRRYCETEYAAYKPFTIENVRFGEKG